MDTHLKLESEYDTFHEKYKYSIFEIVERNVISDYDITKAFFRLGLDWWVKVLRKGESGLFQANEIHGLRNYNGKTACSEKC